MKRSGTLQGFDLRSATKKRIRCIYQAVAAMYLLLSIVPEEVCHSSSVVCEGSFLNSGKRRFLLLFLP